MKQPLEREYRGAVENIGSTLAPSSGNLALEEVERTAQSAMVGLQPAELVFFLCFSTCFVFCFLLDRKMI